MTIIKLFTDQPEVSALSAGGFGLDRSNLFNHFCDLNQRYPFKTVFCLNPDIGSKPEISV